MGRPSAQPQLHTQSQQSQEPPGRGAGSAGVQTAPPRQPGKAHSAWGPGSCPGQAWSMNSRTRRKSLHAHPRLCLSLTGSPRPRPQPLVGCHLGHNREAGLGQARRGGRRLRSWAPSRSPHLCPLLLLIRSWGPAWGPGPRRMDDKLNHSGTQPLRVEPTPSVTWVSLGPGSPLLLGVVSHGAMGPSARIGVHSSRAGLDPGLWAHHLCPVSRAPSSSALLGGLSLVFWDLTSGQLSTVACWGSQGHPCSMGVS